MNKLDLNDPFGVKDPFNVHSGIGISNEPAALRLHLRVQQRNARQRITTLSGFPADYDLKTLSKDIKKKLCCNGSIAEDPNAADERYNMVLQFSGDQRNEIAQFLVDQGIVSNKKDITIHGY